MELISLKCGSEQVPPEAQLEPLTDVERFLSLIRFDSRGKVKDLGLEIDSGTKKGALSVRRSAF